VQRKSRNPQVNLGGLYFTGKTVSLHLVDMLLTRNSGKDVEEAIRNGINSLSLTELNTIVRQVLLYCGVLLKTQVCLMFSSIGIKYIAIL
jgi:hypothetical protein